MYPVATQPNDETRNNSNIERDGVDINYQYYPTTSTNHLQHQQQQHQQQQRSAPDSLNLPTGDYPYYALLQPRPHQLYEPTEVGNLNENRQLDRSFNPNDALRTISDFAERLRVGVDQPQPEVETPNTAHETRKIESELKQIMNQSSEQPCPSNQHQQQQHQLQQLPAETTNCTMPSAGGAYSHVPNSRAQHQTSRPYVEIVEQPADCALRFRYECEGRSAGSLPGVRSTANQKTYPAIQIHNHRGWTMVCISCVTVDEPYLAHPHRLVGKEGQIGRFKEGVCAIVVQNYEPGQVLSFPGLGVQKVKRRDIKQSLESREARHLDPFHHGFAHKDNSSDIDLNAIRLCFDIYTKDPITGTKRGWTPVVSNQIRDKKASSELNIVSISHCSAPATGGRYVILLCDRVLKDDIALKFYEERDGKVVWQTVENINPTEVHHQFAIRFYSPKYRDENIAQVVSANIQLLRPSTEQVSEPVPFQFLPVESTKDMLEHKRQKLSHSNYLGWMTDQQQMALGRRALDGGTGATPSSSSPSTGVSANVATQQHQQPQRYQQVPTTQSQQPHYD